MLEIQSASNDKFKLWTSLLEAKGIKANGLALLSGAKLIAERTPNEVQYILLPPKAESLTKFTEVTHVRLASPLFQTLDIFNTRHALAVVRAPTLPEWTTSPPQGLDIVLALSDPGNLGACLRSAEALGAKRILLARECSSPYLPKALRAAAGATFRTKLFRAPALNEIKLEGEVCGLDMEGEDLTKYDWPRNLTLILGEEGQGLPASLKVHRLKIPMQNGPESLNAVVAAALAMFHYGLNRTR